mgnify:CR=1 FL=1
MKKVFIAEDDPFILDIASTKLIEEGYEVIKTADGASVIDIALEQKPDILLLDLMLPNEHGMDILEKMRTIPELAHLPVVIFSNENGSDVEEHAKRLNADYFYKALTGTGELIAKIKSLIT